MISNRRIYLTEDGEAVEDGDTRAHTLLVGEGCQIHDTLVKKHGLVFPEPETPLRPLTEADLVAFRMELDGRAADIAQRAEDFRTQQYEFQIQRDAFAAEKDALARDREAFAQEKEEFEMKQKSAAETTPAPETKATAPADDKAIKAAPENKAVAGPAETK